MGRMGGVVGLALRFEFVEVRIDMIIVGRKKGDG